jgi:PKD repeat protein
MKTITKFITLVFALFVSAQFTYAQDHKYCGTTEAMQKTFDKNPELYQQFLQNEAQLKVQDQEAFANGYQEQNRSALPPIYVIPVVFHILHEYGTENISDAQIFDAMRVLNEDYSKTNADFANTVSAFSGIAADCEIQFALAKKDPNGNCTNGIDRIYSSETNIGDDGSKLNYWPRNKYLNVWVVKTISSGAAGYAYLPGTTAAANDGIMIIHSYIGSIGTGNLTRSHALTHEVGHWLNLNHTWGTSNNPGLAANCSGDDGVTDTPNTIGWTSCNLTGASCGSSLDNVQNFMEYSYCSTMFTAGQKTRMRNALTTTSGLVGTAQRYNLWTTANLSATGVSLPAVLCTADFSNNTPNGIVCAGDSVTFTDNSWNGTPTSWSWTFPGGTPGTSTLANPTITYNTAGVYNVSLTVTDASGSVSATKNSYITVNPSSAMFTGAAFAESFEGAAIPTSDWRVRNINTGTNTWTQTSAAASLGTKSVRVLNTATSVGQIDELLSPSIDMTQITGTSPQMTFKVANAQRTSADIDKLQVYVSTNCGKNWVLRKSVQGTALASGGVVTSSYTPAAADWTLQTVNLSAYATHTNLYIMFRFISGGGNNVYVDEINLFGNTVGIDEFTSSLNFSVFPNPTTENTTIAFDLTEKQNVNVMVYDIVGKEIVTVVNTELAPGEYKYEMNKNTKLAPGVYFVKLTAGTHTITKKLIVE